MKSVLRQFIRESLVNEAVGQALFGISTIPDDAKLRTSARDTEATVTTWIKDNDWFNFGLEDLFSKKRRRVLDADKDKSRWTQFWDWIKEPTRRGRPGVMWSGLKSLGKLAAVGAGGLGLSKLISSVWGNSDDDTKPAEDKFAQAMAEYDDDLTNILEDFDAFGRQLTNSVDKDVYVKADFEKHYNDIFNKIHGMKDYDDVFNELHVLDTEGDAIDNLISKHISKAGASGDDASALKGIYKEMAHTRLLINMSAYVTSAIIIDISSFKLDSTQKAEVKQFSQNLANRIKQLQVVANAADVIGK